MITLIILGWITFALGLTLGLALGNEGRTL